MYLPLSQRYGPPIAIAARSKGDTTLAVRALRESLRRAEPDLVTDAIGAGVRSCQFVLLRAAGVAALSLGVVKDGCSSVVSGLAMGLFIGLAGRAIVRAYLDIDVQIVDPWMFVAVPVPLVLSASCACYFPARRAAGVDPTVALRHL